MIVLGEIINGISDLLDHTRDWKNPIAFRYDMPSPHWVRHNDPSESSRPLPKNNIGGQSLRGFEQSKSLYGDLEELIKTWTNTVFITNGNMGSPQPGVHDTCHFFS